MLNAPSLSEKLAQLDLELTKLQITEDKIESFFQRLRQRKNEALKNQVSIELLRRIRTEDLIKVYDFVLDREEYLRGSEILSSEGAESFDKDETVLPRKVQLLVDIDGEILLILETKSKNANHSQKSKSYCVFENNRGRGKAAWRIDIFDEWFNLTQVNNTPEPLICEVYQKTLNSIGAFENIAKASFLKRNPINYVLAGNLTQRKGIYRLSCYSRRITGTLADLAKRRFTLSTPVLKQITRELLEALMALHNAGRIHQDIKLDNILYDKDYHIKLHDFDLSVEIEKPTIQAISTLSYASPEIFLAHHKSSKTDYSNYFLNFINTRFFADDIRKQLELSPEYVKKASEYLTPHPSNDIWAAGIVIYVLNYGYNISELTIQRDPLLSKLLAPKREDRPTAREALELFDRITTTQKNTVKPT